MQQLYLPYMFKFAPAWLRLRRSDVNFPVNLYPCWIGADDQRRAAVGRRRRRRSVLLLIWLKDITQLVLFTYHTHPARVKATSLQRFLSGCLSVELLILIRTRK